MFWSTSWPLCSKLNASSRRACQLVTGLALLVLVSIAIGLNTRSSDPLPAEPYAIPVRVTRIQPVHSCVQQRSFTGLIKAGRTSELSFSRSAKLIEVLVDEGEVVAAGRVLARLDTRHLLAKQRQLKAQRDQAAAVLTELVAGPRPQTIDAQRAAVTGIQAELELAQASFQRHQRLLQEDAVSQSAFEQAEFTVKSLEARRDAAQRELDELLAGSRPEKIDAQKAMVAQLEAALEDLAHDLDDCNLIAPFSGRIGRRYADKGTIVGPATPVLRLVESRNLEAWIGLPSGLAQQLQPGQSHEVVIDHRSYPAILRSILPELDLTTRTQTVVLQLDDPIKAEISPGQIARIEIAEERSVKGFWLPIDALSRGTRGLWSVLVVQDDGNGQSQAARRDIEVLHTESQRVLVRGTLQPDDRVITSGTHRVVAGQQVSVSSSELEVVAMPMQGPGGGNVSSFADRPRDGVPQDQGAAS